MHKARCKASHSCLLEQAEAGIFRVCRHLPRPVLLYLPAFYHLFLFREDVLLPHANLKALLKAATLAESPIGLVHPTPLIIRTFEIILQRLSKTKFVYYIMLHNFRSVRHPCLGTFESSKKK